MFKRLSKKKENKMNIFTWIGRKLLTALTRIPIYEMYSLNVFNELSKPIINILNTIPNIQVEVRPHSVIGDGNEYYYVQSARKCLGGKVFLNISWRLQDDGWGPPYPVINIEKILHINPDSREGIGVIGIHYIYPASIPLLARLIEQVENHSEELYHIKK